MSTTANAQAKAAPRKRKVTGAARIAQLKARGELALGALVVLAALFLIAVAGYQSFLHIKDVAMWAGQTEDLANAAPLTIDGMILIGSYRLRKGKTRVSRAIALSSMITGLIASLAGNAMYAVIHMPAGPLGAQGICTIIFSAWPVIPLFAALEMLTHTHKAATVFTRKAKGAKATTPARSPRRSPKPVADMA